MPADKRPSVKGNNMARSTERKAKVTAIQVLRYLREDVQELKPAKVKRKQNNTPLALVAKADILQFIADWEEFCLDK